MPSPNRREFLKLTAASAAAAALPSSQLLAAPPPTGPISVYVTAGTKRYAAADPLRWSSSASGSSARAAHTLSLEPARKAQPVLGFGAATTDAACYVINRLPDAAREALLRELFDPSRMGISVCRTCVGSSDYSRNVFSYDQGPPDPQLARFSIEHDKEYILPTLRTARKINPDLFLLASPWSPPDWMKDNNSMLGGTIRRRYLGVYADYIVKFLQAYKAEGIEVDAVTPQNELDTDQDSRMPACLFPQEAEVQYVGEHLGPAIARAGLKTKIWLIDHNYNLWGRAIATLDEPSVSKYTKSIAWHGYLGQPELMRKVAAAHPDSEFYWTEGGPDYTSPDYLTDWAKWGATFAGILGNGGRCIIAWNIALDENGKPNIGPFPCGGVVTINSQSGEITRSGQYWAMAHYSRSIPRNSVVIETALAQGDATPRASLSHLAAVTPTGSCVLVLTNSLKTQQDVQLRLGSNSAVATLPPDSVTTLAWK